MTSKPPGATPALSRPIAIDDLPEQGLSVVVETTAVEREALRALNALVGLSALTGRFLVRREGRTGLVVTGAVQGTVAQTCVVSLEAFETALDEAVAVHFLSLDALDKWRAARAGRTPEEIEEAAEDEPDPILGTTVDLGALTAEHLTLGLDPYPRKPGVRFETVAPEVPATEASPFAALKALRPDGA